MERYLGRVPGGLSELDFPHTVFNTLPATTAIAVCANCLSLTLSALTLAGGLAIARPASAIRDGLDGTGANDSQFTALAQQRQQWCEFKPTSPQERRERFERLRELTGAMKPFLARAIQECRTRLELARDELTANAILKRRDYSFCLF